MTDPRLRTIRTLLCLGLGCMFFGVGWLWAGLGFTALGLFMPVFATVVNCPAICSSSPTTQYQVVISGFTNGAPCTDCGDRNGTWTLTAEACSGWFGGTDFCHCASTSFDPCLCNGLDVFGESDADEAYATRELSLFFFEGSAGNRYIFVEFVYNARTGGTTDCHVRDSASARGVEVRWRYAITPTEDCGGYSSLNIPRNFITSACAHDASAAVITAL